MSEAPNQSPSHRQAKETARTEFVLDTFIDGPLPGAELFVAQPSRALYGRTELRNTSPREAGRVRRVLGGFARKIVSSASLAGASDMRHSPDFPEALDQAQVRQQVADSVVMDPSRRRH